MLRYLHRWVYTKTIWNTNRKSYFWVTDDSIICVESKPQSNRRSAVQWYFHLIKYVSGYSLAYVSICNLGRASKKCFTVETIEVIKTFCCNVADAKTRIFSRCKCTYSLACLQVHLKEHFLCDVDRDWVSLLKPRIFLLKFVLVWERERETGARL